MTVPVWPSELPRPTRPGWQGQYSDPRLKKSGDAGPPGYRRRWSSVARAVQLTVQLSRSQKATFDTFFEYDTRMGVLPFWMPDPTTDGWPMLTEIGTPVLDGAGNPVLLSAQWLCLFGSEMPVERIVGVEFHYSFPVWVMP
ncbi:hypothetical protein FGK63_01730 [Ruegeria sediminis]|uniref:Uncharacterized protein n=1 Tax=Ruegeria sediminis TaxID=2583820 RepID=A0ABY2X359_9RHOB|nr:hypothetical protein [Ruegeria sediminis]TMV09816.1 hypothetical protein FGK63_01730 [Ruegeria sediminis]